MYNQFERMSKSDKDRRCDEGEKMIQESIQKRMERERQFDYDLIQISQNKDNTNKQQFKRQLTSTSQFDSNNASDPDENQFIQVSRQSKRKQQKLNDKERNGEQGDDIRIVDHTTSSITSNYGRRLFINSKSRTNKNQNDDTDEYRAKHQRYTKERKNERNMTTDDDTHFDNSRPRYRRNESENENEKSTAQKKNENEKDEDENYPITKHALQYAVEHHLPPLHIECEPKVKDHQEGQEIVKVLSKHIEKNFRHLNKDFQYAVGFDYWYIDKQENLTCYTRHTELFVYLCEPKNYPPKINNTVITPAKPKHLPSNHSLVLKFVPFYITIEDVEKEISTILDSTFSVEEMKGSMTDKFRHIRLELKSTAEYQRMLKNEQVSIDGYLINIQEFLAPPRLLICSKCNDPGHIRKYCTLKFDACRRCGEDRSSGDHDKCTVRCHRCNQGHMATDYNCKFLRDYRRSLLNRLKEKPNLLPANVRIFIPTDCRDRESRNDKILANPKQANITQGWTKTQQPQQQPFNTNSLTWPSITNANQNRIPSTIDEQYIWEELKDKQNQINKTKEEFNSKLRDHETKYNEHLKKMNVILVSLYQQTKYQNESVERCYTTINEVLPILSSTLEVIQRITARYASANNNDADNNTTREILQHISQALDFIKDRNELLVSNQKALNNLVEQQGQLMINGINNLIQQ